MKNLQFDSEVYFKLQEAEREAELTDQRYSSKEVLKAMKAAIGGVANCIVCSICLLPVEICLKSFGISAWISNPNAADRLAMNLIEAAEGVCVFPYAAPAYQPIRPLKHEYRKLVVQNYLMLYWVDEEKSW